MKFLITLFVFVIVDVSLYANDGAYTMSGNQLIPIVEKNIAVKKEILSIKRLPVDNNLMEVTVYYEFFNPVNDKEVLVGFEAASPTGDVNGTPVNGGHPYMTDFTVQLNNVILPYKVAIVKDSMYYKNGQFKTVTPIIDNTNNVDFFYVYHFKAKFKKGLNIVKHTYTVEAGGSVMTKYDFDYILTAAKRWANKQIDDFTLNIDMGNYESFYIAKGFFTTKQDWLIHGIGKAIDNLKPREYIHNGSPSILFYVHKASLVFNARNFKPKGELYIAASRYLRSTDDTLFNANTSLNLPLSINEQEEIAVPANDFSKKVLKNLAFARRGYIFSNTALQQYFEKMDWYIPNPNYEPVLSKLTKEEQIFAEKYKE
jgi:hypothetical protein